MTSQARVIADSISPEGVRLTTMQLRYPRLIHSEFMTHRVMSKSASSSRAIPLGRSIQSILEDPAEPVEWGSNQRGMQAGEPLQGLSLLGTILAWHIAKRCAIGCARLMQLAGAHKQVANRTLEPWSHISVVVTSVHWDNFFNLRVHEDADPTIRDLAKKMHRAYAINISKELDYGEWHLPYVLPEERDLPIETQKSISAARCARVSYNTHDGKISSVESDLALVGKLMGDPVHATPFEHQATPDVETPHLHGNLKGWVQQRKTIPNEARMEQY